MANPVVLFNAPSHLPTKLTYTNFTVWKTQLYSGLIGHNLLGFIDGSYPPPSQTIPESSTSTKQIPNPDYILWHRQDQLILNAMLGSCIDTIQPHISTVSSSQEAWERLLVLFANKSRSRIMSLKERLLTNSRGTRSIQEYLQHMRAIADDLALVDNPLSEDDLVLYILAGVGPEFKEMAAALRARDTPITFDELYDKLGDYELQLKKEDSTPSLSEATANYTHRPNRFSYRTTTNPGSVPFGRHSEHSSPRGTNQFSGRLSTNSTRGNHWSTPNNQNRTTNSRSSLHCRFCDRPGHATNECRKLARFLRENDVQTMHSVHSPQIAPPTANATTFHRPISPSWLFDTGASHHVTSDTANLHTYSDYGGPDEIHISDGSGLHISHIGHAKLRTPHTNFALNDVLCVPSINRNLISVAKFCQSNNVSLEFFPLYFLVKDLRTGAPLLRGENVNDVYCMSSLPVPQAHSTSKSPLIEWHQRLGHPSLLVLRSVLQSQKLESPVSSKNSFHCNFCACNKSHKLPFDVNSFTSIGPQQVDGENPNFYLKPDDVVLVGIF
ncbi:hypothetical protein RJ640_028388 [Escallonia rubra]|uniref:GAG-pre-integrase domain-containing protein n=1 Tax=Escallonia rubra TaxID=112253 RepID=A0AA88R062_9ASTE|nr:hypothetical protein RJ640_028388 [Escallonia rubra]